jgi:hypothetical protein
MPPEYHDYKLDRMVRFFWKLAVFTVVVCGAGRLVELL